MKKILFFGFAKQNLLLQTFCFLLIVILFPSPAFAASALCTGDLKNFMCLEFIFANILSIAVTGASIASFVMILMGGFSWLSSGGDPKHLEQARDKITYGIAGLALIILAWFILKFIYQFTNVDVTQFEIPQ